MNSFNKNRTPLCPLIFLTLTFLFAVDAYCQFAGGWGTEEEPWLIATAEHLDNIRDYLGANNDNVYFKQVDDIDLGSFPWNTGEGWQPIGPNFNLSFRGYYDGNYHTISNLTIRRPEANNQGLFGVIVSAGIKNLQLKDVDISGLNFVGGLVGVCRQSSLYQISVSGAISGRDNVGGLSGINQMQSEIDKCSSTVEINGRLRVAGLTGGHHSGAIIRDCFATGNIVGQSGSIGGLVGRSEEGLIKNSYSTGSVETPSTFFGGLLGSERDAAVTSSYWDTETSGVDRSAGGEGRTTAEMTYPYTDNTYEDWDFAAVWRNDRDRRFNDGYPFHYWAEPFSPFDLTAEVIEDEIHLSWTEPYKGAPDFYNVYRDGEFLAAAENNQYTDTEAIDFYRHLYYVTASFDDYESDASNTVITVKHPIPPFAGSGSYNDPYLVETAGQLSFIAHHQDAHFLQTEDIDLAESIWNENDGWLPISEYYGFDHPDNAVFSGVFDGNGHSIKNLRINRPIDNNQGLFSYTENAEILNVRLKNVQITGHRNVGGVVGFARNTIVEESSVTGEINGTSSNVGGLIGQSVGTGNYVRHCYTGTDVQGLSNVGGLIGYSTTTTFSIENCYTGGSVRGQLNCVGGLAGYSWGDVINSYTTSYVATTDTIYIGGLIGRSDFGDAINSYWNTDTTNQLISDGGYPKSSAEMLQAGNYEDWDFEEIWAIAEGSSFPRLYWQEEDINQIIPGPYSLRAVSGSSVVRLSWQPPITGNITQYKLYRDNQMITEIAADHTEYTDTSVRNFNSYSYRVVALLDNERYTSFSNPAIAVPFTFAGGDGTINNPYLVESAHQLHAVKTQLDKHYRQTADIYLDDSHWYEGTGWQPIGNSAVNSFTGSYDGGGHRITGLRTHNPETDYQGLFGYIRNATIRNLGIINGEVTGRNYVGGLAGKAIGSTIENCFFYGEVTSRGVDTGGLAGTNRNGRIVRCFTYGTVNANDHNVGGLVGRNENSLVDQCYSMADVTVTPVTDFLTYDIGGLVGFNTNNSVIRDSGAGGNVHAVLARRVGGLAGDNSLTDGELGSTIIRSYAVGNVFGDSWVGGLVGRNYSSPAATTRSLITKSYSTGEVYSLSHNTGGLVARNDNAVIEKSYSNSNVGVQSANSPYNQGGLVGRNTIGAIVRNCYATGDVNGHARVASVVGDNFRDTGEPVTISHVYGTGSLSRTGGLPIGGVSARNEGGEVNYSYWNVETTGVPASHGGSGRNTEAMTYPYTETYRGWDFENIWTDDTDSSRNDGYPYFRWQRFVSNIALRGAAEMEIPLTGLKRYEYQVRLYDHADYSMPVETVTWQISDRDGYDNVSSNQVTIDDIGNVTVRHTASPGEIIVRAASTVNPAIYAELEVQLARAEIRPYPAAAVNPEPEHRAEAVSIKLDRLSWQYQTNITHKKPLGFRVYFSEKEEFGDDYQWIEYSEDQDYYYSKLTDYLQSETTYYWQVIPTTREPERRAEGGELRAKGGELRAESVGLRAKGVEQRATSQGQRAKGGELRAKGQGQRAKSGELRAEGVGQRAKRRETGDAVNCPVWSFTTRIDLDIEDETDVPMVTRLHRNFPNPFNPYTFISFDVAERTEVTIDIFNIKGSKVINLYSQKTEPGSYQIIWTGNNDRGIKVSSGVYFYRMRTGSFTAEDKMLLLK